MATPNYAYEKRQRELDKKRKKEEKLKRKHQSDRERNVEPGTPPAHEPTASVPPRT